MSAPTLTESDSNRPQVSVETLGCKVNLFESEYISSLLQSSKWVDKRDVCIVNTCTVTREADRQSRQTIRRTVRNNPNATVIVTGCYAEMQPDACANIPGVDYIIPGSKKLQIPKLISGEISYESLIKSDTNLDSKNFPEQVVTGFESRTRAYLQVQQGCDNGCTFCIIHKARGPSRSILPTAVFQQVATYVGQGFAEIVVCGIDLGSYGEDLSSNGKSQISLTTLVSELAQRNPSIRFRLSSIDPAHITSELIDAFERYENICPHIHLSLQSASPIILKRMKRRYLPDDVYVAVNSLRSVRPDLVLSADIMAGFPTESDEDFEMTRTAIDDLEIAYPHVFTYSERDDTPAARIPKQVSVEVRKARAKLLREAGDVVRSRVLERHVGQVASVLTESKVSHENNEMFRARLANYLPVYFESNSDVSGQNLKIKLTGLHRDGLFGILQGR